MCSLQNNRLLCKLVSTCKPPPPSTVCPARCLEAHLCILHHQPPFPAAAGQRRARRERRGHYFPLLPASLPWLGNRSAFIIPAPARGPTANSALSSPGRSNPRTARASHSCRWGHLTVPCLPYLCSRLCKQTLHLSLFI